MPYSLAPSTTALLLLDFQPSVLGSVADVSTLTETARGASDAVRASGGHVFFVRVAFEDDDYAAFPADSMMGTRVKSSRPAMDADAHSTQVHGELGARPVEIVRKVRVGAFSSTDLHRRLRALGITTVVVAGVHTSGAVLTTVREAHDLDYQVYVVADACADPDLEVHDFLLERIFPKQARVLSSAELSDSLV